MSQNIKTIKVGTFNLMNLMLPDKPAYGGTLYYSQSEYSRKAKWVEFMLNQMDADVICFQELFHREALTRIIKNMPKYRRAHLYVADETGDQPCVALLSRYPVENVEVYEEFPEEALIDFNPKGRDRIVLPFTTFTRPVLKADIRIDGYGIITVFSVHLKSKREIFYADEDQQDPVDLARAQSRSLMLRASESVALRSIIAESLRIPERPVVVCGDVNDIGTSVTTRIISGEVPEHRLSDRVKKRVWDLLLYHVKDIQARRSYQDFYYTHIHNGMYESLDHIMVSQELVTEYPRNTGRVGLVSVYNDHLIDQTFTSQRQDKCKSDHGVVVCTLELDLDRAARFMTDDAMDTFDDDDEDDEPSCMPLYRNSVNSRNQVEEIDGDDMVDAVIDNVESASLKESPETILSDAPDSAEIPVETEQFDYQKSLDKWQERYGQNKRRSFNRRNKSDNRDEKSFNRNRRDSERSDNHSEKKTPRFLKRSEVKTENSILPNEAIKAAEPVKSDTKPVADTQSKEKIIVVEKQEKRTTSGGRERHIRRGIIASSGDSSSFEDDLD